MKHKLVLIFDDDSKIDGLNKIMVFNNVLDAENFLLSQDHILRVKIDPESHYFTFKMTTWGGGGSAYWALDKS